MHCPNVRDRPIRTLNRIISMEVTEFFRRETRLNATGRSLRACWLFERDPALLKAPYVVKSRIPPEVFCTFVDAAHGSEIALTVENVSHLSLLCEEFEFGPLSTRILSFHRSILQLPGSVEALHRCCSQRSHSAQSQVTFRFVRFIGFGCCGSLRCSPPKRDVIQIHHLVFDP
jgi:hypothetical protein